MASRLAKNRRQKLRSVSFLASAIRLRRQGMIFDHVCRRCGSEKLVRAERQTVFEDLIYPVLAMYRCDCCYTRQAKFQRVKIGNKRKVQKATYTVRW